MSCYFPLRGFKHPFKKMHNGSDLYVIKSQKHDYVEFFTGDPSVGIENRYQRVTDFVEFPCGCCIGCQLDHASEWTGRILAEASVSTSAYFVTLTYDDEHLKYRSVVDPSTGEVVSELPTLFKRDVQLFHKRLRRSQEKLDKDIKIRFFLSGEYGSSKYTHRPHYHAIYFNLKLPDELGSPSAPLHKLNHAGDPIYKCDYISNLWQNGFITIAPINEKTAGYVSRYTLKKLYRNDIPLYRRVESYRHQLMDDDYIDSLSERYKKDLFLTGSLTDRQIQKWVLKIFHTSEESNIDENDNIRYPYERVTIDSAYLRGMVQDYIIDGICLDVLCNEYRTQQEFLDFQVYGPYACLEPEFQLSSTSPGLGYEYLKKHKYEIIRNSEFVVFNKKFKIPRYFFKMLEKDDIEYYKSFKEKRQAAGKAAFEKWQRAHPGELRSVYLKTQHEAVKHKLKILKDRSNIT